MNYFRKILGFARPYRRYGFLNIFFNILYALFSALSFAALIPMLDVLFKPEDKVYKEPIYNGFSGLKDYLQEYINSYQKTDLTNCVLWSITRNTPPFWGNLFYNKHIRKRVSKKGSFT